MDLSTWTTTHGDRVTVFPTRRRNPFARRYVAVSWLWHVQAANGEIVEQGESYVRRADAIAAAERHHPRVTA